MSERTSLLNKLNAYAFAAYDWNLYLDTHPKDKEAIAMFHRMAEKANALKMEYESKFGPLTAEASRDMDYWNWLDEPWPWEKA